MSVQLIFQEQLPWLSSAGAQPPSLAAGFGTEVPLYGFHDDDFSTRLQAAALVGLMLTLDDLNLPGLIEIFMDFYGFVTDYCVANPPINQRRVISPRFMILGYL